MLMFKGQPDGRIERRLHKNSLLKDKRYLLMQPKIWNNNEEVDQRDLEEVLSFCIEEGHDASDG